jgi:peptide-methionine (S)-S-oxide reductase
MGFLKPKNTVMPAPEDAPAGRDEAIPVTGSHYVLGRSYVPPFPDDSQRALFGMGCFWGAERRFWEAPGVYATAVGYTGGFTRNPTPTQGMRQGNDIGTQYRSGIYCYSSSQVDAAEASRELFQRHLGNAGFGLITTEIEPAGEFYYAEEYHQQYLAKIPGGYCGLGGTGVSCPMGLGEVGPES